MINAIKHHSMALVQIVRMNATYQPFAPAYSMFKDHVLKIYWEQQWR